jgi:hypothetical protein
MHCWQAASTNFTKQYNDSLVLEALCRRSGLILDQAERAAQLPCNNGVAFAKHRMDAAQCQRL